MPRRDLAHRIAPSLSLAPIAKTASTTGTTAIDTAGYESAAVLFLPGVITDGTHTPKLQESATTTNADFTDVVAADQEGTLSALASGVAQWVGYKGSKRYIRAYITVSGATTGGLYSVVAVLGHPHTSPTF